MSTRYKRILKVTLATRPNEVVSFAVNEAAQKKAEQLRLAIASLSDAEADAALKKKGSSLVEYKKLIAKLKATKTRETYFGRYTRATEITNLRVRFEVEKTLDKKANKAKLYIYNLAPQTRAEFQTQPAHIHLEAGYQGVGLSTVYKGDVYWGKSRQEGTEWVTEVECGAGINAQRYSRSSMTLKAGASTVEAIKKLAAEMGLPVPTNLENAKKLLGTVQSGMVIEGPTIEQLNKLVQVGGSGLSASIQDDQLVIIHEDGIRKTRGIHISVETGMVGSPEYGTPAKRGGIPPLSVTSLLNPDIQAGGLISVGAEFVKGNFKVHRVVHTGDNYGPEWFSTCEAKAYQV